MLGRLLEACTGNEAEEGQSITFSRGRVSANEHGGGMVKATCMRPPDDSMRVGHLGRMLLMLLSRARAGAPVPKYLVDCSTRVILVVRL